MNVLRKVAVNFRGFHRSFGESVLYSTDAAVNVHPKSILPLEKTSYAPEDPFKHDDFFGVHKLFTIKDLFDARVHFGHKEGTLNQQMLPYIFGSRLGVTIIDLNETAARMREALNFIAHISYRNGIIMFVSSCRQTANIVEKTAEECGQYSHCRRFVGLSFINPTAYYGAITRLPDLIILLNTQTNAFEDHRIIQTAARVLIPTVAILDSNANPTLVTYPVPGNDDTPCAIKLYCKLFKEAVLLGQRKRKEMLEKFGTIVM